MSRFAKFYVSVFAIIWVGYGLFSVLMKQPHSLALLLFGASFAIVFFLATWFSQWIFRNYKRIDAMAKTIFAKRAVNRK
ncbi:hypothetical protein E4665_10620 [Sporolactobacillus shoreae]|uniref:Uncharacterized protein n=1 Tax=Sporolactobacillus shoreae TaxID=1465501 RepID=A0A4Z0GLI0_9BACL|nr:hypothetical protein [Sporolactobacillus shoreae]TGA97843.1 hypothetical protein E4665_10620 [Sporolactobacillus shoreae]